ncbi:degenerin unc-8 [Eurytemora carolleeae]|uniref:degenerin unc-8 n=1 Tax=Eurytemora carolleeae TaxID=1294199 RepID=UPI000C782886|nr:degenerin unc-8 [Eurytemora carolleeae]|eukprot:XP_023336248.1 degenerin unc-8-like [Eurytemora affinis]
MQIIHAFSFYIYIQENTFVQFYMNFTDNRRTELGHPYADFVKACTFRGKDCNTESFFLVSFSPNYGNCYTFNLKHNPQDTFGGERLSSQTGPSFGLSLVLNINQADYMSNGFTANGGARVSIQSSDDFALPDEFGMDVFPSTTTNFAIRQVTYTRLQSPYASNCTTSWQETIYTSFPTTEERPYSINRCKRYCLQETIMNTCSCYHPLYVEEDDDKLNYRPCQISAGKDFDCIDQIIQDYEVQTRVCPCNAACLETEYEMLLSTSQWPSTKYQDAAIKEFMMDSLPPNPDGVQPSPTDEQKTTAGENLIHINVYFSSLNSKSISEVMDFSSTDGTLISGLGGVLSMYLGISVCQLLELFELLMDLILNTYQYCSGRALGREYLI